MSRGKSTKYSNHHDEDHHNNPNQPLPSWDRFPYPPITGAEHLNPAPLATTKKPRTGNITKIQEPMGPYLRTKASKEKTPEQQQRYQQIQQRYQQLKEEYQQRIQQRYQQRQNRNTNNKIKMPTTITESPTTETPTTTTEIPTTTKQTTMLLDPFLRIGSLSSGSFEFYLLFVIGIISLCLLFLGIIYYLTIKKKKQREFKSVILLMRTLVITSAIIKICGFIIFIIKYYEFKSLFIRSTKLKIISIMSILFSLVFFAFYTYLLSKIKTEIIRNRIRQQIIRNGKKRKYRLKPASKMFATTYLLSFVLFLSLLIIQSLKIQSINADIMMGFQSAFFFVISVLDVACSIFYGLVLSGYIKDFISDDNQRNAQKLIELEALNIFADGTALVV